VIFINKKHTMSKITTLPSYAELTTLLNEIQPGLYPAEVHGLLCGYICVIPLTEKLDPKLAKLILGDAIDKNDLLILSQLYEASYHSLKQFSFEFNLILPDDDADINSRTEALGVWCQGFLTGLAQSPKPLQEYANSEITEALDDLTEIAQVNFGKIETNEDDEAAYFELVEYVRLTALMFFNELQANNTSPKGLLLH
jgi:uncharacterized protein YgfB (UPF0149 family)